MNIKTIQFNDKILTKVLSSRCLSSINNILQNNLLTQTQFLMRDTLDLN